MLDGTPYLDQLKKFRDPIIILLALFVIIVVVKAAITAQMLTPVILADEAVYDDTAQNILTGKFFSTLLYCQTYPPGYSLILSIAYLLPADKIYIYHTMLVINAIVSTSIIFPAYFILRRYCPENVGISGSLLVALLPSVAGYTPVLMSENLFIPLLTLSVWLMLKQAESPKKIWQVLLLVTLAYLAFIRTIAAILLAAYAISLLYEIYLKVREGKLKAALDHSLVPGSMVAMLLLGLFGLKVLFNKDFTSYVNRYDNSLYVSHLIEAFTRLDALQYFFSMILHELEYLAIVSLLIFAMGSVYLTAWLLIKSEKQSEPLRVTVCFAACSILLGVIATATHMYIAHAPDYQVFGRYVDPFIPVIIVLGTIGLWRIGEQKPFVRSPVLIAVAAVATAAILALTYPSENYKFGNMFAGYYVNYISGWVPFYYWITIAVLVAAAALYAIVRYKNLIIPVLISGIIISILITGFIYSIEIASTQNFSTAISMVSVLRNNDSGQKTIVMDSDAFNESSGPIIWYTIAFWTNDELIREEVTSINLQNHSSTYDYVISSKVLPYDMIQGTTDGFKLYKIPEQVSISATETIPPSTIAINSTGG